VNVIKPGLGVGNAAKIACCLAPSVSVPVVLPKGAKNPSSVGVKALL